MNASFRALMPRVGTSTNILEIIAAGDRSVMYDGIQKVLCTTETITRTCAVATNEKRNGAYIEEHYDWTLILQEVETHVLLCAWYTADPNFLRVVL